MANKRVTSAKTPEQRQQERRERFIRLAPKRVTNALRHLANVAKMGNRAGYSYSNEEGDRIVGALQDAVVSVRDAFGEKINDKVSFTL